MKRYKVKGLLDGKGHYLEDKIIEVQDDKIVAILDDTSAPTIDYSDKYMMPGLIDCHTHVMFYPVADVLGAIRDASDTDLVVNAIKNLEALLRSGVTYIRDVGGVNHLELALRKYIKSGIIMGPDMLVSGKIITMTGGHGWPIGRESDGVDEVRKAVREQLKMGVDVIKVISSGGVITPGVDINAYQFNIDELSAAKEEAHKAGRKICTHCHSLQGIKNSILAGIDSVEHATMLDDEAIQMAVDSGTYFVPTLSAVHFIVKNGVAGGIPEEAVEKAESVFHAHMSGFKSAYDAGVKIAMGTDIGTPFNKHGISSAFELELMVNAGMRPEDAIIASTSRASELLGIDQNYGSIEVGKHADFLILNENPLMNIKTIQKIYKVIKNGLEV